MIQYAHIVRLISALYGYGRHMVFRAEAECLWSGVVVLTFAGSEATFWRCSIDVLIVAQRCRLHEGPTSLHHPAGHSFVNNTAPRRNTFEVYRSHVRPRVEGVLCSIFPSRSPSSIGWTEVIPGQRRYHDLLVRLQSVHRNTARCGPDDPPLTLGQIPSDQGVFSHEFFRRQRDI